MEMFAQKEEKKVVILYTVLKFFTHPHVDSNPKGVEHKRRHFAMSTGRSFSTYSIN